MTARMVWAELRDLRAENDELRGEVRRLRLAMEESADFACFNENRVGDPCACCEHVMEIVDNALSTRVEAIPSTPQEENR